MGKVKKEGKIFISVAVAQLENTPVEYDLIATEKECQTLAQRFELPKIDSLNVHLSLFRDTVVHIRGHLISHIKQVSVVSLKQFATRLDFDFEVLFSENPPQNTTEIVDIIENGRIDLGHVIAEQFGLNLDPFPHAPDEKENFVYTSDQTHSNNPFAQLDKILKK